MYNPGIANLTHQYDTLARLTGPFAEEQCGDSVGAIFLFLVQHPLDDLVTLQHLLGSFLVDFVLLQILSGRFPGSVRGWIAELLIDSPNFVDIVVDLFEPLEGFKEDVELVGVVNVGVVFPLDMKALVSAALKH